MLANAEFIKKVSSLEKQSDDAKKYLRAEAAQQNGFENLPGELTLTRIPSSPFPPCARTNAHPASFRPLPSATHPLHSTPPVFIGALLAGNLAHLAPSTLNAFAAFYLASRVAYNLLYINVTNQALSFLRSASFLAGVVSLMTLFVKSGNALNKF